MKATKQQKADALARIQSLVKPGDTIWTQFVSVSRSGMLRTIKVFVMRNNEPINITYQTAQLLDCFGYDCNREALKITGCGMDVGFEAVYDLARTLYRNGFRCAGENCVSNDHTNGDPKGYSQDEAHIHSDGGYAFRQRWL